MGASTTTSTRGLRVSISSWAARARRAGGRWAARAGEASSRCVTADILPAPREPGSFAEELLGRREAGLASAVAARSAARRGAPLRRALATSSIAASPGRRSLSAAEAPPRRRPRALRQAVERRADRRPGDRSSPPLSYRHALLRRRSTRHCQASAKICTGAAERAERDGAARGARAALGGGRAGSPGVARRSPRRARHERVRVWRALAHFERALALWSPVPGPPGGSGPLAELWRWAASSPSKVGAAPRAVELASARWSSAAARGRGARCALTRALASPASPAVACDDALGLRARGSISADAGRPRRARAVLASLGRPHARLRSRSLRSPARRSHGARPSARVRRTRALTTPGLTVASQGRAEEGPRNSGSRQARRQHPIRSPPPLHNEPHGRAEVSSGAQRESARLAGSRSRLRLQVDTTRCSPTGSRRLVASAPWDEAGDRGQRARCRAHGGPIRNHPQITPPSSRRPQEFDAGARDLRPRGSRCPRPGRGDLQRLLRGTRLWERRWSVPRGP
jgi:hypothetical protein